MTKITTLFANEKCAYTTGMSFFVQPTAAPQPKTKNAKLIGLLLAGILLVMAVAQLFTFEKFPDVLMLLGLPLNKASATLVAALIVTLEVAAQPFLLGMLLSPAAQSGSMAAGWLVVAWWLIVSVAANVAGGAASGFLGATIPLPAGWWAVCLSMALAGLDGWAAWGMWPFAPKGRKDN